MNTGQYLSRLGMERTKQRKRREAWREYARSRALVALDEGMTKVEIAKRLQITRPMLDRLLGGE